MEPVQAEPQRKGMSKGCLIALIVGGILLLLVIALFAFICANKERVMKYGTTVLISSIKPEMAKQNIPGLDTAQFNAFIDSFAVRFKAAPLDTAKTLQLTRDLQGIMADKKIDANDVEPIITMITNYFPDLEAYKPAYTPPGAVVDSTRAADTAKPADTVKPADSAAQK